VIAIEAAMGAVRRRKRNFIMATIGSFKKAGNEYKGSIITLSVQAKNVRIVPETNATSEKAPTHRLYAGEVEIGAAWTNPATDDRKASLSVKLDDPSFTAPVHAMLFEGQNGDFDLVWSRPAKRRGA
jgi:uncharacterized protein (DUF736 family)